MATKEHLFEDVSMALETWVSAMTEAVTLRSPSPNWVDDVKPYQVIAEALNGAQVDPETVRAVMSEGLRGFAHSIFVALDGGTKLAEHGRLHVVNSEGEPIGE